MSIVSPESKVYQIISGEHKGRSCVVANEGDRITDFLAKVVFEDSQYGIGIVKKGYLAVLDVPGWPEKLRARPYGLEEYLKNCSGDGSNALRTDKLAQPRALNQGDVLATGEVVMENPRQGFSGSALIHLDKSGWVELVPRLPIALQGNKKFKLPAELTSINKLATGCRVAKNPTSVKINWVTIYLDSVSCCIDVPSCVPLALA